MSELQRHDLKFALLRAPRKLLELMKSSEWAGKVFIGGGYLRSIVSGEPINDVDVFVNTAQDAKKLSDLLAIEKYPKPGHRVFKSDNAYTVRGMGPAVQIIHRWVFNRGEDAANSFDFTICCAMFWWGQEIKGVTPARWLSYCDDRFYPDLAAKRLVYRKPVRNEDAGGSMLRVLKYYQKGYRIPLDSLSAVIARLMTGYTITHKDYDHKLDEENVAKVVCGLLREVDPDIDPNHIAHLPADNSEETL